MLRQVHSTKADTDSVVTRVFLSLAIVLLVSSSEVTAFQQPSSQGDLSASPWPGADRLFRTDSRWIGCTSAVSFTLTDKRIVWMFSESRIDPTSSEMPEKAITLHNSLALQIGNDPATAELVHFWDATGRRPGSFFREGRGFWYWPVDGIQVGSSVFILLFKVRPGLRDQGPEIAEWSIARIINVQDSPARWKIQWLPTPANQFGAVIGYGGLIQIGAYIITGARRPENPGDLYLVRWPLDRIVRNDFTTPQWWSRGKGWIHQESLDGEPSPVASDLEGDLLLHWDSVRQRALILASSKDKPGVILALQAPGPTGPWSEAEELLSLDGVGALRGLTLRACRGLPSDETVIAAVPVSATAQTAYPPRLLKLTAR